MKNTMQKALRCAGSVSAALVLITGAFALRFAVYAPYYLPLAGR